ncbi:hypothetical protein SARC_08666 [Sphaeroforma arctica JP610]|uniref:Uncharacterized protein n=1 Tax=Sphaeroforma arctica JP610 TaxID=667725 RepID=A0A0L0FQU5_9EUKA|nr:hypothetical protein SARC_08666 [Sphaeroforma arctica JP610]KNC78921.1 hypothetical protein SARC_08666 [Sphaeroforma arctica JP610]|eukprot:XP_014152823.1 hypothetical protein SARC_08666 [Sphaeroforma arctica JP610]
MSMMNQPSLTDITVQLMNNIDNIDIERICQNIEQCMSICRGGRTGCSEGFLCQINHVRFHKNVKRARTYSASQYDRSGQCDDETTIRENDEGQRVVENLPEIARELNEYKTKEMAIHPMSEQYTALCPL